jgi:hypothetical protein
MNARTIVARPIRLGLKSGAELLLERVKAAIVGDDIFRCAIGREYNWVAEKWLKANWRR